MMGYGYVFFFCFIISLGVVRICGLGFFGCFCCCDFDFGDFFVCVYCKWCKVYVKLCDLERKCSSSICIVDVEWGNICCFDGLGGYFVFGVYCLIVVGKVIDLSRYVVFLFCIGFVFVLS